MLNNLDPLTGAFNRRYLETALQGIIDGGRSLWDIRVNLKISRQEVWTAHQRLLEGGLIGSNLKAKST
jgi:hypothetical protein